MAGWLSRLGGGGSGIQADLRRITDSDVIDVPKDALMNIVQASHSADDRREIMTHIRECLAETSQKRWRRIHGGQVLLEQLLQRGSRALVTETSQGMHFDVVQRLTFLERFEFKEDVRVQAMVRQKASVLRGEVLERMENPGDSSVQSLSGEDAAVLLSGAGGSASPDGDEASNAGYVASAGSSATATPKVSKGPSKGVILNGVVSVGHNDDTTSESSGAEDSAAQKRAAKQREEQKRRQKPKDTRKDLLAQKSSMDDSTDSDGSDDHARRTAPAKSPAAARPPPAAKPSPAASAAQSVDLLGGESVDLLGGDPVPAAPAPAPATQSVDLLGM